MAAAEVDVVLDALTTGCFDRQDLSFTEADRALLVYARKLTLTPGDMNADDVQALRHVGFDDRAIHDACAIVSYFAFVNRIADGLGVELEERFSQ